MTVQRLGAAPLAESLSATVELPTALLGWPTVSDGDRWAQVDIGGTRVMPIGTDRDV
ncbi:hypothetical protein [Nocardia africana]